MFKILRAEFLAPGIKRFVIEAPRIAHKQKPGQFVILRLYEQGERIPITIESSDAERGTIGIVVPSIGKTTLEPATLALEPESEGVRHETSSYPASTKHAVAPDAMSTESRSVTTLSSCQNLLGFYQLAFVTDITPSCARCTSRSEA
jgi:hypothetical protein